MKQILWLCEILLQSVYAIMEYCKLKQKILLTLVVYSGHFNQLEHKAFPVAPCTHMKCHAEQRLVSSCSEYSGQNLFSK